MSEVFGSTELFDSFSGDVNNNPATSDESPSYNEFVEANGECDKNELLKLKKENLQLKSQLLLYEKYSYSSSREIPIAEIKYFRSPLSSSCQARLESEMFSLLTRDRDADDEKATDDDVSQFGHVLYLPFYIMDSVGKCWKELPIQYGDDIPLFTQLFNVALDDTADKFDMFGAKLPKDNLPVGPECFNCGGPHKLSDCKQPKDKKRIANALKEFKESRGGGSLHERYHVRVVKEIEDRYKDFVPGHISDNLRTALGLEDYELPPHIYRMRNFGYPPAYSIDPPLLNSEGKVIMYFDKNAAREEGELEEVPITTVIPYPGYTAPLTPGTVDKFRSRNTPYSAVTPTLSDKRKPKAYPPRKRRKLDHTLGEDDDMEIDAEGGYELEEPAVPAIMRPVMTQSAPPIPREPPPQPPAPPQPESENESQENDAPSDEVTTEKVDDKKETTLVAENSEVLNVDSDKADIKESKNEDGEGTSESGNNCVSLDRSIVSEKNKIGIKFDQQDDFGPIDDRAGNFTKLQSILKTRKKSIGRTPTRSSGRIKKKK